MCFQPLFIKSTSSDALMAFGSVFHSEAHTENALSPKAWLEVGTESKDSEDDLSVRVGERQEITQLLRVTQSVPYTERKAFTCYSYRPRFWSTIAVGNLITVAGEANGEFSITRSIPDSGSSWSTVVNIRFSGVVRSLCTTRQIKHIDGFSQKTWAKTYWRSVCV